MRQNAKILAGVALREYELHIGGSSDAKVQKTLKVKI